MEAYATADGINDDVIQTMKSKNLLVCDDYKTEQYKTNNECNDSDVKVVKSESNLAASCYGDKDTDEMNESYNKSNIGCHTEQRTVSSVKEAGGIKHPSVQKYYAADKVRNTGIYTDWGHCAEQVLGFTCALYKSFKTQEEAELFIHCNTKHSPHNTCIKTELCQDVMAVHLNSLSSPNNQHNQDKNTTDTPNSHESKLSSDGNKTTPIDSKEQTNSENMTW